MIKAKTFLLAGPSSEPVVVDVITGPNRNGLCSVAFGKRKLIRHVDRLEPLDAKSRKFLGK